MPGKMHPRHHDEMQAIVVDKLKHPRTIFFPGHRIRMNVVPMFLNLFIPWAVFLVCCGLTGFWLMFKSANIVMSMMMLVVTIWLGAVALALREHKITDEPSWYKYIALMYALAVVAGGVAGHSIYMNYTRPYYEIQSLKVVHHLDAGRQLGQDLMDAGIAYFAHNNHLEPLKSWHFKHRTLYCVAPIVGNESEPETRSYDFWAVGTDCCGTASADFRCGDWGNPAVRSGLRVLDSEELMYYRLAVQQAETLYGIVSTHPVFFTWVQDPLAEINSWNLQAFKNYVFLVALSFVVSLIVLVAMTAKFAWIGRAASVYGMEFYDDPEWSQANTAPATQGQTRNYSTMPQEQ